jgi:hypothetical protein
MTARELAASGKMPMPDNVPFQPSSLGFDPGADDWQDPPFGEKVPKDIEKKATEELEDDLEKEKKRMEEEAEKARREAERLEEKARKAEEDAGVEPPQDEPQERPETRLPETTVPQKAQRAQEPQTPQEAKQEKEKTARSRAKAALEYAGALLRIAAKFVVKIVPRRRR